VAGGCACATDPIPIHAASNNQVPARRITSKLFAKFEMEDPPARCVKLTVETIGFVSKRRGLIKQVVDRKSKPGSVKTGIIFDRVRNRKVGKELVVDPVEVGIWII
jgi:hypothetical protein